MTDAQDDATPISKSAAKREASALQALAVSMVDLPDDQLARLPLPERLHDAIVECRRITSRGALRRQRQYLGRLMRSAEVGPIREALAELEREAAGRTRHFHTLEHWRDRLIDEGDTALDALLAEYPRLDRAPIRQFVRQARREIEADRPRRAARALFRHLRERLDTLEASAPDGASADVDD
jgi:ribosome-associated protein